MRQFAQALRRSCPTSGWLTAPNQLLAWSVTTVIDLPAPAPPQQGDRAVIPGIGGAAAVIVIRTSFPRQGVAIQGQHSCPRLPKPERGAVVSSQSFEKPSLRGAQDACCFGDAVRGACRTNGE
ncbi:hypothetical protein S40288_11326 [Stachybotrys chartarum IBT 40288]|nr:hypothetical protein S40288_11326 [Stachybotrys chartarum IBT 40288]